MREIHRSHPSPTGAWIDGELTPIPGALEAKDVVWLGVEHDETTMLWESVRAVRLNETEVEIRSVPLFAYDVNYGDTVRVEVSEEGHLIGTEVVHDARHFGFRIALEGGAATWTVLRSLIEEFGRLGCLIEGYSASFLGISCEENRVDQVAALLQAHEDADRLDYETARTSWTDAVDDAVSPASLPSPTPVARPPAVTCPHCGWPDGKEFHVRFALPDAVFALAERDQTPGTWMSGSDSNSSDHLHVPGVGSFLRSLLPVTVTQGRSVVYGVWVAVELDVLRDAMGIWDALEYADLTLQGTVANDISPGGVLDSPVEIRAVDPNETPHCVASPDPRLSSVLSTEWPCCEIEGIPQLSR